VAASYTLLDPKALTISFARRFATYKRATLIFHDPARLAKILGDPERPVQLLFAGKAHPRDDAGKEFLRRVGEFSQQQEFLGRVVLLEDYDVGLARQLVSGADVWLNNPRRPMEASGTSGMKAAMNGALNLSVRDGWWDEAPREAGFTIGEESNDRGDDDVASALYDALEREVVPLFYARDAGENGGRYSAGWTERMVASMSALGTLFSTDRMLGDYLRFAYVPAADRVRRLEENDFARGRALANWKQSVVERWGEIGFISVALSVSDPARLAPGETFRVEVQVRLGSLTTDEIAVDWFEGTIDHDGVVDAGFSTPLSLVERVDGRATYSGVVLRPDDDSRGYSVRLRPTHPDLVHSNETGLVLWAG
jgi:starch phosphorylase